MRHQVIVTATSFAVAVVSLAANVCGIENGQIDTFDDGSVASWREGGPSPNMPVVVGTGGNPGGFLENVASGTFGPGGRMVMFNRSQWRGDYLQAGVTHIGFDVQNGSGPDVPLYVALAFEGPGGRFGTSSFSVIDGGDGGWNYLEFELNDMELISGGGTLEQTLANVADVRILSAVSTPNWLGDAVAGIMRIDNIQAISRQPGDLNEDGLIDALDAGILFAAWGGDDVGDINRDGIVDAADAGILFANWSGESNGRDIAAVPEPCGIPTILLGFVSCWMCRVRSRLR